MPRNRWPLILVAVLLVLLAAGLTFGTRLIERLSSSVSVAEGTGFSVVATSESPPGDAAAEEIAGLLRAAGLSEEPLLGSVGVAGHLERLASGAVSADTLRQYAADLAGLNAFTAANGALIPTTFWDVQTEAMTTAGDDVYTNAFRQNLEGSQPYTLLLAQAYERFTRFKAAEAGGGDTAVDASLDLLLLVDDYYLTVSGAPPGADDPEGQRNYANGEIMVWQSLIAGTSRINPLTGAPLFSHGTFGHYSVAEMWRHAQQADLGISEVWGLTGFTEEYVGVPENSNQVEHMSISAMLQMVLDEPLAVLNGIEEQKVLQGEADPAEARADQTLNGLVHRELVAGYAADSATAVAAMRCNLKGTCE